MAGTDLGAIDEQARTLFRRRHLGFIFQFFNLIPLLTVEENLLLPLELTGQADAAGRARSRRAGQTGYCGRFGSGQSTWKNFPRGVSTRL